MQQAYSDPSKPLPPMHARMLSRAEFGAHLTNDPEVGGASMDLHSLKAYNPGDNAHMVSSATDRRTGKPFPTQLVDQGAESPKLTGADVMDIRRKMGPTSQEPGTVLGTWNEPGKHVAVDMSTAYGDKEKAKTETLRRNEDAMFSMHDMSETSNEDIRKERGITGARPAKAPGQEEVYSQSVQLGKDKLPKLGESRNQNAAKGLLG